MGLTIAELLHCRDMPNLHILTNENREELDPCNGGL
jgi:hypothetical protein